MLLVELLASLPYYVSLPQLWEMKQTCHSCTVRRIFSIIHIYITTWNTRCQQTTDESLSSVAIWNEPGMPILYHCIQGHSLMPEKNHPCIKQWTWQTLNTLKISDDTSSTWNATQLLNPQWSIDESHITHLSKLDDNFQQFLNFDWSPSLNWQ